MHATIRPKPPSHLLLRRALDLPLSYRYHTVIIAVGVMGKVQVPIYEEIRMVAVRHGFVAAIGAVGV